MMEFLVIIFSILSGLGLYWVFKYKVKLILLNQTSTIIKSCFFLLFSNFSYWFYFIVQSLIWKLIVVNSKGYEISDGNSESSFVTKDIALLYNNLTTISDILTISIFVAILIIGYKYRKQSIKSMPILNSTLFDSKLNVVLLFLVLKFIFIISIIMLAISIGFSVSYIE